MKGGSIGLQQFRLEAKGCSHQGIRRACPVCILPSGAPTADAAPRNAAAHKLFPSPCSLPLLGASEQAVHLAKVLGTKMVWDCVQLQSAS